MRQLGAFGGFGGARPGARPGAGAGSGAAGGNFHFEDFDIGGLGGLGDIFSSMFGSSTGQRARNRGPERGQDIEMQLAVPFRVAALGEKVPIELEVNEECPTCHGSGAAPGAKLQTCPECSGRGTISFGQGGFAVQRPCPMCLGRGQVPTERCPTCNGAGEVRTRKKVLITVPPGTDNGSRIRLKGQGGRGQHSRPALGHQTVAVRREGLDVIAPVPINIAQATLGSRISVRTLDGKRVAIRIPPGTSNGKRFRVRGHGLEKDGAKGDLIVQVDVQVPEKLTEDQEKAMKEFAEASGLKY